MNVRSFICLKVLVCSFVLVGGSGAVALADSPNTLTAGAAARPTHTTQALPAALRPVLYQALAKDAGPAYHVNKNGCAVLPKQALKACFDSHGAHFSGAGSPLTLHLVAWGRGSDLAFVTAVRPKVNGNQVNYAHGDLSAWWRVLPVGFEQGFTIARRPSGNGGLTLALAASRQDAGAPSDKSTQDTLAWGKLRYGELVVTDAKGKVIPATLTSQGDRIRIAVNDSHAAYPLTVDPLVWLEQKVTSSDGAEDDEFGFSVAVSGSTALVGTPLATVNGNPKGAAYVFGESGGTWTQTQKLTASDGAAGEGFGFSVALAGTTALVGAWFADVNGNTHQGAAYAFSESGGTWSQTQKLTASDGAMGDVFGHSVALAGTTALVGTTGATVNGNTGQGAAYVFGESGGSWSQTQKLTASDGATSDHFGWSVALAGTTALVGAYEATVNGNTGQGAAYVFGESGGSWSQTQKLTASDGAAFDAFGVSVALAGTTALVGASGATVNGNTDQGAAYVFGESGGNWTQTQKLTTSGGAANDFFGNSVALAGSTALVGVQDATVNGNYEQGAAYVFDESGGSWTQTRKLTASDGAASDHFGTSVALAGTTALVGALDANVNGNDNQGAAYFYGASDLGFAVSAPATVSQGQNYISQAIATNNTTATSPAVTVTVAVPAAASLVGAGASQGNCNVASQLVSCDLGGIAGNAGTATVNVVLKATGDIGTTIENTASVTKATPPPTASAPTAITGGSGCPEGYSEYGGSLSSGERAASLLYHALAGEENGILTAPAGFQLYVVFQNARYGRNIYRIPGNEMHRQAPAGYFGWVVKAGATGGDYTFCLLHP